MRHVKCRGRVHEVEAYVRPHTWTHLSRIILDGVVLSCTRDGIDTAGALHVDMTMCEGVKVAR